MTEIIDPNNSSEDLNFLMDHVELVDEEIKQWINETQIKKKPYWRTTPLRAKRINKYHTKTL